MFEQAFKNIDDVLWKEAGCTTELDYTEQTSWLLFLKYLDGLEPDKAMEAELEGRTYSYILDEPYRWERWTAPKNLIGALDHNAALTGDDLREFVALQQRFADSPKSWSVDAASIDPTTFDLSGKNPNGGEEITHRNPQEILDEIAALDAESAEVLQTVKSLLA